MYRTVCFPSLSSLVYALLTEHANPFYILWLNLTLSERLFGCFSVLAVLSEDLDSGTRQVSKNFKE